MKSNIKSLDTRSSRGPIKKVKLLERLDPMTPENRFPTLTKPIKNYAKPFFLI
jgi:hypothetical protein